MYSRVYVEITNVCNLQCSFCHGHHRPKRFMTDAEFARVLEQLQGKTGYLYYHLMGEPLLHPALPRFLQMAKEKGFRSNITTNGTLLPKLGACLDVLHKVNISLHSQESGDPAAYLQGVSEFVDSAQEKGVIVSLRLWTGKDERLLRGVQTALPGDWTENTRGYRIREKVFLEFADRFDWPDREAEELGDNIACYGMRDHFGILCDGTVVPCCLDSNGVIDLGNVLTEELSDILASPRATAIRKGFQNRKAVEDLCRRCGYAQRFAR